MTSLGVGMSPVGTDTTGLNGLHREITEFWFSTFRGKERTLASLASFTCLVGTGDVGTFSPALLFLGNLAHKARSRRSDGISRSTQPRGASNIEHLSSSGTMCVITRASHLILSSGMYVDRCGSGLFGSLQLSDGRASLPTTTTLRLASDVTASDLACHLRK